MSKQNLAVSERPAITPERDAAVTARLAMKGWADWIPGDGTTRYRVHVVTADDGPGHAEKVLLINSRRQTLAFQDECPVVVVMAELPPEELDKATWWYEDDDEGGGLSLEAVTVTNLPPFACYLAQPDPESNTVLAIGLRIGQIAGARDHGQQLFREHRCRPN